MSTEQKFLATVDEGAMLVFDDQIGWRSWLMRRIGQRVWVTLAPWFKRRTILQNARYWSQYVPFAADVWEQRYGRPFSKEETHDLLCKAFLGIDYIEVDGKRLETRKHSSELDTAQFAAFNDRVELWIWEAHKVNPQLIDYDANL